jgi:hypothetical protein
LAIECNQLLYRINILNKLRYNTRPYYAALLLCSYKNIGCEYRNLLINLVWIFVILYLENSFKPAGEQDAIGLHKN